MDFFPDTSWKTFLQPEFDKPYFETLRKFVQDEYLTRTVYPSEENIFHAFRLCPFEKVKVVLLGQDPYHEPGQAHGLCFSVSEGCRLPPSLKNIFKEIRQDLGITPLNNGNLTRWAQQGVLLLNATLTVRAGEAGSHQGKGWEHFTDTVIHLLETRKKHLVFLLWGTFARKKAADIRFDRHLVLQSAHPSPLSAYRGFFGNKHFSQTNHYLEKSGKTPIDWK